MTSARASFDSQASASFRVWPGWLRDLVAMLLLALFALAIYRLLLFTNRVLAEGDILLYFYPYRDFAAQALRSGRIPLWNPYLFLGAPFLANPQAAVLYPLHWPLAWMSVTHQVYWSAALHTWIAGAGTYFLMRRLAVGRLGALTAGIVLCGSGFFVGMLGHINQMNGGAWLPWALLLVTPPKTTSRSNWHALRDGCLLALIVALMLLAGHTQTTFINLVGAGIWVLALAAHELWHARSQSLPAQTPWFHAFQPLLVLAGATILGVLLCAPQLLPTLELSELGLRSGGLTYQEATSFSLQPLHLPWTLLPTYGLVNLEAAFATPAYTEFAAWIGISGLLLAAIGAWRGRGLPRLLGTVLLICGLLLAFGRWNPLYYALYSFIPGFDLFRTPARWMMLYTTGAAILAGLGAQTLLGASWRRQPSWFPSLLLLTLVAAELLLAARALPQAEPTAPQAVYDLRSAPAHLSTDPVRSQLHDAAAGRFLGMSTITYDPGDMADYRRVFVDEPPPQLSEEAFADLTIAQKVQELLVPNLPLLWRIPAVDGYDGGLLPLQRYNLLASLLLPDSDTPSDGRLREQVRDMPSSALLGLFNSQYVLTDKVRDLWFEDVFYDRQIGLRLSPAAPSGVIEAPAPFEATHLDLIAFVDGAQGKMPPMTDDELQVVATVTLTGGTSAQTFELTVGAASGAMLADGGLDSAMANSSGAVVAYRDVENSHQEYRVRLPLSRPTTPTKIEATLLDPQFELVVQAATLFDERTSMFHALLPSDRGDFRLVHSGDVKVYENRDVKPRASLAHRVAAVADAARALEWLQSSELDADAAVVEGDYALLGSAAAGDSAQITAYAPERVEVATHSADEALLVLSDAHYPGWKATVDGTSAQILYTNLLMRGVPVPAGDHIVVFTFEPNTWQTGLWIAAFSMVVWLLLLGLAWFKMQRRQPAAV